MNASLLEPLLLPFALRHKHWILVDLSFPETAFPEFKKAYDHRLIHLPCRQDLALGFVAGLASAGKMILLYGSDLKELGFSDESLNIKLLVPHPDGTLEGLHKALSLFGPTTVLIPQSESSKV